MSNATTFKNGIPADRYYELLEWKDASAGNSLAMRNFSSVKGAEKRGLHELSTHELRALYFLVFKKHIVAPEEKAATRQLLWEAYVENIKPQDPEHIVSTIIPAFEQWLKDKNIE